MRRVLVVGCGGSGAKTLAYMMDQLHADLAAYGIGEIPGCWQFLSVDTPLQEERMSGLGSVTDQGGNYVSCGVQAGSYSVVDESLTRQVTANNKPGLRQLATWIPRTPSDVPFPVTVGAGQCRGIGRLLILDRLSNVRRAVEGALARMASPDAVAQAEEVARRVPGLGGAPDPSLAPMVLVISSMAGGSGASMTLDVCRIIAGIQSTPAIDPGHISVFLYTAEVFNEVPRDMREGMPGNTLAMLGEIIAAQSSGSEGVAAQLDEELYTLLGSSVRAERPFKRVIPIGLRAGGTGAVFGDGTTNGVFRGIGRGLARFIASPAFESFVQYDIANAIQISNRENVSWGVNPTNTAWGSFGYASMGTGRDRYAEYAAQRIARRCVDHLLDGFRTSSGTAGDSQRLDELWYGRKDEELTHMHLPVMSDRSSLAGAETVDEGVRVWLLDASPSGVANQAQLWVAAQNMASQVMAARAPHMGQIPAAEWVQLITTHVANLQSHTARQLEEMAVNYARDRAQEIHRRIVDQIRRDLADLGLPYALRVLAELRGQSGYMKALSSALAVLARQRTAEPLVVPAEVTAPLVANKKQVLHADGEQGLAGQVQEQLAVSIYQWLGFTLAHYLSEVVADIDGSALKPLEAALNDYLKVLTADRGEEVDVAGFADLATDLYAAWPTEPAGSMTPEQIVPQRFSTAHNEVVLMHVTTYPSYFVQHITSAVPQEYGAGFDLAYGEVVREVILGEWQQGAGLPAPADLITIDSPWLPAGLPGMIDHMPAPAVYSLRAGRRDILRRARAYVGRRGESFETFVSQSLRDYLVDGNIGEHDRARRIADVVAATKKAMGMARPLVDLDPDVYQGLHGTRPTLTYTFSTLPFLNTGVAPELTDYAEKETSFDGRAVADAMRVMLSEDDVSRVDMFGSYPRTLPAAYAGLLKSVAEAWHRAGSSAGARESFWKFRRARPLPAGLPMGDAERRTMVRGWWVAFLCAGIERPAWGNEKDSDPISVWSADAQRFIPFPAPMLTSYERMMTPNSALAAVLESILLAYLSVDRTMEVFTPWRVLRGWADDSLNEPASRYGVQTRAQERISELLGAGHVEGLPTPTFLDGTADPEVRRERLLGLCDQIIADLEHNYLPGEGKADGPQPDRSFAFTNFQRRQFVEYAPLSIDLAQEMKNELEVVRNDVATVSPKGSTAMRTAQGMVY